MAYDVPDLPVTGTPIETTWGVSVRDSLLALDPTGVTAGRVLLADGTATPVYGIDPAQDLIQAAGDILYGSAADTLARLPKSSDGYVLSLASGLPAWSPVDRWEIISEGSFSNAFTYMSVTGIDASFDLFEVFLKQSGGSTGQIFFTMGGNHYYSYVSIQSTYTAATNVNGTPPMLGVYTGVNSGPAFIRMSLGQNQANTLSGVWQTTSGGAFLTMGSFQSTFTGPARTFTISGPQATGIYGVYGRKVP